MGVSHVEVTSTTATLVGKVTNETGFAIYFEGQAPAIHSYDPLYVHEFLFGDFSIAPTPKGQWYEFWLQPGASKSYRSVPHTMHTADRVWETYYLWPANAYFQAAIATFCHVTEVPTVDIFR